MPKEAEAKPAENKNSYTEPKGSVSKHSCRAGGRTINYTARAQWLVLRKKEKPLAEMFHIAYLENSPKAEARPVTFIFNGGPGAASAYLHMGVAGPKRAELNEDGSAPKPPMRLVDNADTWLAFSDLVFVDPIGTGFSRMIDEDALPKTNGDKQDHAAKHDENEFFKLNRDLESIVEFVSKFLSKHKRWESPVFVAGESYGGFRTACLAKRLQEKCGVGLNGVIIISPALEFIPLNPDDYDTQGWLDLFPSQAAAAAYHGKSRRFSSKEPVEKIIADAEVFAYSGLSRLLSLGDALPEKEMEAILARLAEYNGMPADLLRDSGGRIPHWVFSKKLLKDRNKICGLYDATLTGDNPFPDRECSFGPDPTLSGLDRIFSAAINTHLRKNLALETDRDYHLLNYSVNTAWKDDTNQHVLVRQIGATDELRYGMALNPHMKVMIAHGYYDLVTPYHSSARLARQMKLPENLRKNLSLLRFKGGHMFYAWDESRRAFTKAVAAFVKEAL